MIATALLLLVQAGSPLVQIDSRQWGRTFIVDPDRKEIRQALRDVAAGSPAGSLPSWLPPYPGASPWGTPSPNHPTDFGSATYTSSAAPDAVFAHYETSVRAAAGVTITYINRQPGRGGAMHLADATQTAVVSVSPGPRGTSISVNWHPKSITLAASPHAQLSTVWYNDDTGTLRLKDGAGKEYDLDMSAMLSYAHSRALAAEARADFPPWLAIFPKAHIVVAGGPPLGWKPQVFIDMKSYSIEMEVPGAAVPQIATFYRDAMARNGLTIVSQTENGDRSFAFEARNAERTHQVYLDVLRRSTDTFIRLMDHYTTPRP
jgi:hypothetical protein